MAEAARQYTLNRNYTLHSRYGHSIRFLKGESTLVPPTLFAEVLAIGATRVDGGPGVEESQAPAKQPELDDSERGQAILAAVELIIERNNRMDFTAGGSPTVKAVEKITGFDVFMREVNAAVQDYHNKKAED